MSSKNYEPKIRGTPPYLRKTRLKRRIKKKPPKFCSSCRETSEFVNLLFIKVNKIEEIINDAEYFLNKTTQMELMIHLNTSSIALVIGTPWTWTNMTKFLGKNKE
jgi:hypothetical protein